ncbi:MAG: hypothetical protein IK015_10945 [Treponema sp.]|nr:hypothetical protein [Treponema sp.]
MKKIIALFFLLFIGSAFLFAEDAPIKSGGWRWDEGVNLNGKVFYDVAESYREQDGWVNIKGYGKLHFWLYDTYTYWNGDAKVFVDQCLPAWIESMGYVIDFDYIKRFKPNERLASSIKTLMSQKGCDIAVTFLVGDRPDYPHVHINYYDRENTSYWTEIIPLCSTELFVYAIQDIAARTACVGQYSSTQSGGNVHEDPHDYYTAQTMAYRLKQESGNMTRTSTFYGICFDYAQFAFDYINKYLSFFKSQGLYEEQFWIVGNHDNSSEITLQYPGDENNYNAVQNGVYVIIPNNSVRNVKSHDGATDHAWLWIERLDGVWFWIDPTWTDNVGYPVYGYIKNGKEIQCRPFEEFCVKYPNSLKKLPLPPPCGKKKMASKTANSKNRKETIDDAK